MCLVVALEADPCAKAKKVNNDLIVKLMEEANDVAEHKGWCDTELSTNEHCHEEEKRKKKKTKKKMFDNIRIDPVASNRAVIH